MLVRFYAPGLLLLFAAGCSDSPPGTNTSPSPSGALDGSFSAPSDSPARGDAAAEPSGAAAGAGPRGKSDAGVSSQGSSDAGASSQGSSDARAADDASGPAEAGADAAIDPLGADASSPDGSQGGTTLAGKGPPQPSATGYGQAATGGADNTPVRADTLAALQDAVDAYSGSGGLVLEYTGTFDFNSIADPCVQHTLPSRKLEIKNKGDVTLRGADGSAANFGIHVAGAAHNIIIQNMTIGLTPGGSDSDMISLEGMSSGVPSDVWIDHNELFSSMAECPGAGDTAFDGMIDIKKGADHVTVSYNSMHDHHKVSLNGYSDKDDAVRHVTFDHNLFEHVGSRTPLQRFGYSHVLNNHFLRVLVSCINVRMGGYALVEGNFFEHVKNPVTSRDSASVGYWDLRSNNLQTQADVTAGNAFDITWDDGNDGTVNATDWTTTKAFPEALGYSYHADPFGCVRDGLRAVVGPGKGLPTLACP